MGLAPFLRLSIAGIDFRPACQEMLEEAQKQPENANLWMNLSIALFSLGLNDEGLAIQQQALSMQRIYHLPAEQQPARIRLLVLASPGNLSTNTPIDCLLENSDIDITYYFCSKPTPLADPVPEHDVLMVALGESNTTRETLLALREALRDWPRPIINTPQHIPAVERNTAGRILQGIPGLLIPPTLRAQRADLTAIAQGNTPLSTVFEGLDFPVILRPIGSHGGRDLEKIENGSELTTYLNQVRDDEFYLSRFIDYRSADGNFRKIRIALVEGVPYVCHMAISSHWMIHYVNAGMYEDAGKRAEEADFMQHFDAFVSRHRSALDAIFERSKLDYVCLDCAETLDGELLIFEIDHAMIVHAMDSQALFPHKQQHIHKLKQAFREHCLSLMASAHGGKHARACHEG